MNQTKSFAELGINDAICEVVDRLGWTTPTAIQVEALPPAFEGRDVIGLAETGSGKTAAFVIPIIQALMETPRMFFGLIVTPTRELAIQIKEQVKALGAAVGARCVCLVGGAQYRDQALQLSQLKPHIIIGTPGRLVDHLENTQSFELHLKRLKYLVLDEADRLLNMDFEVPLSKIISTLPKERHTYLFSATMTKKVEKLQRASLKNPIRVEVSQKSRTVAGLAQYYILVPHIKKDCALTYLFRHHMENKSVIVFVDTCRDSMRLAMSLRYFGVIALPLNGQMTQNKRLAALNKFRAGAASCLVATDVASRGLDIPQVDTVLIYNVPSNVKDYVHRVGRTARAGRNGQAITFVSQYDADNFQLIEKALKQKLDTFDLKMESLNEMMTEIREADRIVRKVLSESSSDTKKRKVRPNRFDEDDTSDIDDSVSKAKHPKKSKKYKNK